MAEWILRASSLTWASRKFFGPRIHLHPKQTRAVPLQVYQLQMRTRNSIRINNIPASRPKMAEAIMPSTGIAADKTPAKDNNHHLHDQTQPTMAQGRMRARSLDIDPLSAGVSADLASSPDAETIAEWNRDPAPARLGSKGPNWESFRNCTYFNYPPAIMVAIKREAWGLPLHPIIAKQFEKSKRESRKRKAETHDCRVYDREGERRPIEEFVLHMMKQNGELRRMIRRLVPRDIISDASSSSKRSRSEYEADLGLDEPEPEIPESRCASGPEEDLFDVAGPAGMDEQGTNLDLELA
ncbi:unnamed protein product [Zymoseptoria tritici ST99CH_3D1]|nr:unnamed protein product [Zymoseptoria tritici ST99CH_1E4]SMR57352.1 unnamed protein product [Zymoseptoria tritici ST99CH_3D1]